MKILIFSIFFILFQNAFAQNSSICLISKEEKEIAKDYIIQPQGYNEPLKMILTVTQIRIMNKASFSEVHCGLVNFLDNFYATHERRWDRKDHDTANANLIFEYVKILEFLRSDFKYKTDFESTILKSSDFDFYFSIMNRNPESYNSFDPIHARKFFSDYLLEKNKIRPVRLDELQVIFDLFYSKGILPPKELNNLLKMSLLNPYVFSSSEFMDLYLSNTNDLAYNDLFKYIFDNIPKEGFRNFSEFKHVPLVQNIFSSTFLPDSYKCLFANNVFSKNFLSYSEFELEEIHNINNKCLKDVLADSDRFITPSTGCPEILFKKDDSRTQVLSRMSKEFSKSWSDCRNKCSANDKCLSVKDSNGIYNFVNSKFSKDVNLYSDILNMRESEKFTTKSTLVYEYKPVAICRNDNKCGEKDLNCNTLDVAKKVNAEILSAKFQQCKTDADCYVWKDYDRCLEFPINVKPSPLMGRVLHPNTPPNISSFIYARVENIKKQCEAQINNLKCPLAPQGDAYLTKVKCEKNICILVK